MCDVVIVIVTVDVVIDGGAVVTDVAVTVLVCGGGIPVMVTGLAQAASFC